MTSTVIVQAHCTDDKEVHIEVTGDSYQPNNKIHVLQDKEEISLNIFDNRSMLIREVIK